MITTVELEEGMPQDPPKIVLELTIAYFRGKEIDLVIHQASKVFLSDDDFINSRAFKQFLEEEHSKF